MNYQEALAYLDELNAFGSKLGLRRISRLLELLESPQERYRTIHVTGTNGKGSVTAMTACILSHSGICTGMYTSPHLMSYTERIQIDGQPISKDDFARCLGLVRKCARQMIAEGGESPTQFEVLTAVAFSYFALRHVEYAVIEVGLGGLLDSTNVIVPEVSVITNVTLEHADRCGGTLEGVAHHKAGIIKSGVPVVTAAADDVLPILQAEAQDRNADVFVAGQDFSVGQAGFDGCMQKLEFSSQLLGLEAVPYSIPLLGSHQAVNSALAFMTACLLHNIDERITAESAAKALPLTIWPGRFEHMVLGRQQIIIDGAHNPAGMKALRQALDTYYPAKERVFLLGILKDKAISEMLPLLLRPNDTVVVTRPQSERACEPEIIAHQARVQHIEIHPDNEEALDRALELANGERLFCAAGSLYLIGGLRQMLLARQLETGGDK